MARRQRLSWHAGPPCEMALVGPVAVIQEVGWSLHEQSVICRYLDDFELRIGREQRDAQPAAAGRSVYFPDLKRYHAILLVTIGRDARQRLYQLGSRHKVQVVDGERVRAGARDRLMDFVSSS